VATFPIDRPVHATAENLGSGRRVHRVPTRFSTRRSCRVRGGASAPATWSYTFKKPADGWQKSNFDAKEWKQGPGGFGTAFTPGSAVHTEWTSDDVWIRREIILPEREFSRLQLLVPHDDDAEVYPNGISAANLHGYTTDYEPAEIRPAAKASLKPGKNVLAAPCHQIKGGQYIDAGLVEVLDADR
jgi:hypothetical protein